MPVDLVTTWCGSGAIPGTRVPGPHYARQREERWHRHVVRSLLADGVGSNGAPAYDFPILRSAGSEAV